MTPGHTLFRRFAALVKIRDISRGLGRALEHDYSPPAAMRILEEAAQRHGFDPTDRYSLVMRENRAIGWISFFEVATTEAPTIARACSQLSANDMISADIDALQAVQIVVARNDAPLFVLDGNVVTSSVEYQDLFAPAFRLCLFALTLQLESIALNALLPVAVSAIGTLSAGRLKKASFVHKLRFGDQLPETPANLLRCTTFIDKGDLLAKRKLVPTMEKRKLKRLFLQAERVRNYCAHPTVTDDQKTTAISRQELTDFIEQCHLLMAALEDNCGE